MKATWKLVEVVGISWKLPCTSMEISTLEASASHWKQSGSDHGHARWKLGRVSTKRPYTPI